MTAEQAQVQLYHTESRLRFLLGIPATDGRLIRPKDDPTTARIDFDWDDCLNEALARSVEIREARQRVKQRELGVDRRQELAPAKRLPGCPLPLGRHGKPFPRSGRQQLLRRGR